MRSGSTPGHAACLVPPLCWALAASLHLPGAEAEDQQAEDGSGRTLAPSEGWVSARLAGGRGRVGGPSGHGTGCPGGPRARLMLGKS